MEKQVGFANLIERALEGFHEVCRQFADESDGIAEQEGQVVHDDLANRCVEGCEELVLGKDLALGEEVHQGALAHIRIANESHANHAASVASLSGLLLVDFCQSLLEQADAVQDDSTVHFELRLTRSAKSYRAFASATSRAATLSLEVRPEPLQTGQHIAILSQFDLRLGIGRLCSHGEDVEDEVCAVQYLDLQLLLDVAKLLGREFIIEDDHRDFSLCLLFFLYEVTNLLKLADAQVGDTIRAVHPLGEATNRLSPSRLCKERQFIEIFGRFAFVLIGCDETNQHGSLRAVIDNIMELHTRHSFLKRQRRA